ncbi:MFS transporter [Kineococcus sp. GCM10028916]|uniref:MFS transporter n=1 Tax=Kineococcus sp. GCM10028916 TaxID=3273394 RepID=UPI003643E27E
MAHTAVGSEKPPTWSRENSRSRWGLLVALAVDNVGSGLFLPLVLVYSVQVVGLSVGFAGTLLFLGTLLGLGAPLVVGTVVDRFGPRRVVITSQLLQTVGMTLYLLAGTVGSSGGAGWGSGVVLAIGGAVLVAAGTQTFYSSLFSLISAVAGDGPKDGAFAHVEMIRSAAFGLGALVAAALLTWLDTPALRIAVAVDALTFLLAAGLLWRLVAGDLRVHRADGAPAAQPVTTGAPRPWRDRPFLVLLVLMALTGLATDVFLVGFSVWALDRLHAPAWVPGACVVLLTAVTSTGAGLVVRWTSTWKRTRTVALGTALTIVWCAMCAGAPLIGRSWQPVWLLVATGVLACSGMLTGRVMAMAEASAPVHAHGRYMATVQYSFNAAALLAPLLVGLFAVGSWLPWAAVASGCAGALVLLPWLARRLPARAVSAQ